MKKINSEIETQKKKQREEAIEKGHRFEQISSDIYFLNQRMKELEKEIIQATQQFQNAKNKHIKHREIAMRLQFLSRALNGTIRYLKQNKLNSSMINPNDI